MLLSAQENTADFITSPTADEMASAITKSIRNVMAVVCHSQIAPKSELTPIVGQSCAEVETPVPPKIQEPPSIIPGKPSVCNIPSPK